VHSTRKALSGTEANLYPFTQRGADWIYRLPTIHEFREFAAEGGLMSYGADIIDVWRRTSVAYHPAELDSWVNGRALRIGI
jgi:hypothetical protein